MGNAVRQARLYIDGEWRAASDGRQYHDLNPFDGSTFAIAPAAGGADARAAITAAARAFPEWSKQPPQARAEIFLRGADLLAGRIDELCEILTKETGATQMFARFQAGRSIESLRIAAGWPYLPAGQVLRSSVPERCAFTTHHPLGVVFGITPWNGANILAWRTILTPLAFGNTVVLKPSEEAPVSAGYFVAEVMHEAGLPAGVLNVISNAPGEIAPIMDAVMEGDDVRLIMFTGSAPTARLIAEQAGRHLKRTVLELGGYNPLIILDDADLDRAIDAATFAAFFHQGQICMNARKIILQEGIADAFVDRFVEKVERLKVGDPADPQTFIGPLITDRAATAVESQVNQALADGGRLLCGGRRDGSFYSPTVLSNVPGNAHASQEEIFGPVVLLEGVRSVEEAIHVANSTRYGLSAAVLTGNRDRGLGVASQLRAGMIQVNEQTIAGETGFPNGGVKNSGWGYTGPAGLHDFTEIRQTVVQPEIGKYPV